MPMNLFSKLKASESPAASGAAPKAASAADPAATSALNSAGSAAANSDVNADVNANTDANTDANRKTDVGAASEGQQKPAGDAVDGDAAGDEAAAGKIAELAGMLNNHKGKLAVGAAAMLGVAIFYKWREGRLAKEDPEEYARLQRLKKAIDSDASDEHDKQDKSREDAED